MCMRVCVHMRASRVCVCVCVGGVLSHDSGYLGIPVEGDIGAPLATLL